MPMSRMHPARIHQSLAGIVLCLVLASCGGKPPGTAGAGDSKHPDPQAVRVHGRNATDHAIAAADAIAREGRVLAAGESASLLARITGPCPAGVDPGAWEHEVNSTLNALRAQPDPVPGLTDALLRMTEEHPDKVLRLYALQHLVFQHEREDPAMRQRISDRMVAAAIDDGGMAGAALMLLGDLDAATIPGDIRAQLDDRAVSVVADHAAPSDVRVSAIHACEARRATAALPALRRIAADTTANTVERRTAIHAIGTLGGPDDRAYLDALRGATPLLEPAIVPAVTRLATAP